ncbi:MAG: alanine racemase [Patescibacteria group bacterium]
MLTKNYSQEKKLILKLLKEKSKPKTGKLLPVVKNVLSKKQKILKLTKKYPTPFYAFDPAALQQAIDSFKTAFNRHLPNYEAFYAVKSNPHSYLIKSVLKNNLGLDVSSGRELEIALVHKAKKIIFSGPGKMDWELNLALNNSKKITIHLDSFGELKRLGQLAGKRKTKIKVGVRVFTKYHDNWAIKFGIPLVELNHFFKEAKKYPFLNLAGIQCHKSLNESAAPYQKMIAEIAGYLKNDFTEAMRQDLQFVDIGGGFLPYQVDGYYPWDLPQGELIKTTNDYFGKETKFNNRYYLCPSVPINDYAKGIAKAIKTHFVPILKNCTYYIEPGRVISTPALSIVLKVLDIKRPGMAIMDGGINIVGWEQFESNYFPVINLTRPALKEMDYKLYGSLCTPDDIWGYYCYTKKIKEGDIIVVPNQGAYTYTLAQNFIKPIPEVRILK